MQIGLIGLGRMGANIVRRLIRGSHEVVIFNRTQEKMKPLADEGALPTSSLDEFVARLAPPRAAWVMVTAGDATESILNDLAARLSPGDILIDGGNSRFQDDVRHAQTFGEKKIRYLDAGVSGGVWGLERGYCLMVGGDEDAFRHLEPVFRTLAPGRGDVEPAPGREDRPASTASDGYLYCGPAGAGHFVKMIHNGIEYGLMQSFAEGFDILKNAAAEGVAPDHRYTFDLPDIAELWRRGSVVGSWLLDLSASALAKNNDLSQFTGRVPDTGEDRWTLEAALAEAVPANVLAAALFARFRSRQEHTFGDKLLSAMRSEFGGHTEENPTKKPSDG